MTSEEESPITNTTFCDTDEECFFGRKNDREYMRRAALGLNFDSPATPRPGGNTPRPGYKFSTPKQGVNLPNENGASLPDVLQGSSKGYLYPQTPSNDRSKYKMEVDQDDTTNLCDDISDIEVIDLDPTNDSVQIISDDSFTESKEDKISISLESSQENMPDDVNLSVFSSKAAAANISDGSLFSTHEEECNITASKKTVSNNDLDTSLSNKQSEMNSLNVSSHELPNQDLKDEITTEIAASEGEMSNDFKLLNHVPEVEKTTEIHTINPDTLIIQDSDHSITELMPTAVYEDDLPSKSRHLLNDDQTDNNFTLKFTVDPIVSSKLQNNDCEIETISKPIDGENNVLHCTGILVANQESDNTTSEPSGFNVAHIRDDGRHFDINSSLFKEVDVCSVSEANKSVEGMFKNEMSTNFQQLNDVSDSVLNISHSSSLHSFSPENAAKVIYEDISYEGDHMLNAVASHDLQKPIMVENDNLHMSVDEPDFQQMDLTENAAASVDISQSTYYTSCENASLSTSYHTVAGSMLPQDQSECFTKYRDVNESLAEPEGFDNTIHPEIENDNVNETSFEMIVQNRQNSFISTPTTKTPADSVKETVSRPIESKLPVFQKSISLIKPPKLYNIDSLKTNTKNWARNLIKSDEKKQPNYGKSIFLQNVKPLSTCIKTLPATSVKMAEPGTKTPSKIPSYLPTKIPGANITPSRGLLNKLSNAKTPIGKQTPALSHLTCPPRLVKSENKLTNLSLPPREKNEVGAECKQTPLSQGKNKYKNVLSPIRAYINNEPLILQSKTHVENVKVQMSEPNKTATRIPVHSHIPTPKPVRQLKYLNVDDQENADPNYARDTLPPKVLQPASDIFVVEQMPKLPMVGKTMQKLLNTPKMKVTVHKGRVESPKTKGISSSTNPTQEDSSATPGNLSIRLVKPAGLKQ